MIADPPTPDPNDDPPGPPVDQRRILVPARHTTASAWLQRRPCIYCGGPCQSARWLLCARCRANKPQP